MFGALIVERDPYRLSDLTGGLLTWIQDTGSFAAVGVLLWLLFGLSRMKARDRAAIPRWEVYLFVVALIGSLACYTLAGAARLFTVGATREAAARTGAMVHTGFMVAGGAFAVLAAALPFLRNLASVRLRRVYALAKLSFKEAIRRRVLYAFSLFLILVLFASWFTSSKPEDQVRTYVHIFYWAMGVLLLFVAVLMAAFSIPTDIKQQTIHTIVTKPVERFEVVLGRFLGFLALMTLVLLTVTALSLFLVLRGANSDAAAESLKAREPLNGDLRFENSESEHKATNVGREWEYRSYITKPTTGKPQTACWDFQAVDSSLGSRKVIRCEYTFDVYRTTKGQEGQDVSCTFKFYTWRFKPGDDAAFLKERGPSAGGNPEKDDALTEKYGYYEINSLPVTDYHTQHFTLPGGLFRNATAADPARESELKERGLARPPALTVKVTCDSATQYVGMAKYDLYARLDDAEGSETTLFAINFFKGAFGLWLQLALIIGLAVVLSTYLSGPITLLVTLALFLGGATREFIQKVALGQNEGGGPMEAMVRITRRELTGPTMRDSQSTGDRIVTLSDDVFRWVIRQILHVIPDVDSFNMTQKVAEGFNISWLDIFMPGVYLFGYLLPWAVLAYYLMKWREVASSS